MHRELLEEVGINSCSKKLKLVHTLYEVDAYVDLYFEYEFKRTDIIKLSKSADKYLWIDITSISKNIKIIPKVRIALRNIENGINLSEITYCQ